MWTLKVLGAAEAGALCYVGGAPLQVAGWGNNSYGAVKDG